MRDGVWRSEMRRGRGVAASAAAPTENRKRWRRRKGGDHGEENTPLGVAINVPLLLSRRLQAEILCGV